MDRTQRLMSCGAEEGFQDDKFKQLGGRWRHPLIQRIQGACVGKMASSVLNLLRLKHPWNLEGNAQQTAGYLGRRLKGNLG